MSGKKQSTWGFPGIHPGVFPWLFPRVFPGMLHGAIPGVFPGLFPGVLFLMLHWGSPAAVPMACLGRPCGVPGECGAPPLPGVLGEPAGREGHVHGP